MGSKVAGKQDGPSLIILHPKKFLKNHIVAHL